MHSERPRHAVVTPHRRLAKVDVVAGFEAALAAQAPALLWRDAEAAWLAVGAVSPEVAAAFDATTGVGEHTGLPAWVSAGGFDAEHSGPAAPAARPLPEAAEAGRWCPALVLATDGRRRVVGSAGEAWLARLSAAPAESAEARAWAGALTALEPQGHFEARVAEAAAACAKGPLAKVVLARAVQALPPPGQRFSVGATLRALWAAPGSVTVFAVAGREGAAFVGASPETLVRIQGDQLRTAALAGTRPQAPGAAAALLADPKDRAEHAAVVTGIRDALLPLTHGLATQGSPSARALPGLIHLETPISARLRADVSAWDVVRALHPTPALGGWPRAEAQAWLRAREPWTRGLYAGPMGWVGADGSAHFVVGIRSAWVSPTEATLFAGAGIVADSRPNAEWNETALKLETARAALRTVPDGTTRNMNLFAGLGVA